MDAGPVGLVFWVVLQSPFLTSINTPSKLQLWRCKLHLLCPVSVSVYFSPKFLLRICTSSGTACQARVSPATGPRCTAQPQQRAASFLLWSSRTRGMPQIPPSVGHPHVCNNRHQECGLQVSARHRMKPGRGTRHFTRGSRYPRRCIHPAAAATRARISDTCFVSFGRS
jgi:hypothetical protein